MAKIAKKVIHESPVENKVKKTIKVRFTKNPTGMFGLAYNDNIVINSNELPEATINELIEKGYLEVCE